MLSVMDALPLSTLSAKFGDRLQINEPLARFTAARVGGPADVLLIANTAEELAGVVREAWQLGAPLTILGGGSNVLVSDDGVRGVVVVNRARQMRFDLQADPPLVWVESGANFGLVARQAAAHGLAGLEWAAGIPGTVGGAVVGNAGAHGSDMAGNLVLAEILHLKDQQVFKENWSVEQMEFQYRSSILKRQAGEAMVLSATLRVARGSQDEVQARIDEYTAYRRRTQPPGASMGSMFKNPPGDFAGRLIDQAGLKGAHIGDAEISTIHANFFINRGHASAADIYQLIQLAQQAVMEKFAVKLELEIELAGAW